MEILGTLGLTLDDERVVEVGDSEVYRSSKGSRSLKVRGGVIVSKSSLPDERPPLSSEWIWLNELCPHLLSERQVGII